MSEYQVAVKLAIYSAPEMTEQLHLERLDRVGGKLATYGAALSTFAATADTAQAVEILMTYEATGPGEAVGEALRAAVEALSSEGYGVGFQAVLVQTPTEWARVNDIDIKS